jgi:hypothetical protein
MRASGKDIMPCHQQRQITRPLPSLLLQQTSPTAPPHTPPRSPTLTLYFAALLSFVNIATNYLCEHIDRFPIFFLIVNKSFVFLVFFHSRARQSTNPSHPLSAALLFFWHFGIFHY